MSDIEDMQKESDTDDSEPMIEEEIFDKDDWNFNEDDDFNDTCDDDDDDDDDDHDGDDDDDDDDKNHLISQASLFSNMAENSLSSVNSVWSLAQRTLPKNIFNFTIRYINNSLPTRKNLVKWGMSPTSDCSFCLLSEILLHVVSGCKTYLEQGRYTWRHDSILNFLAVTFQSFCDSTIYVDLPGFISPSTITGDNLHPDLLLVLPNKCLYILELTVGFELNRRKTYHLKRTKYHDLIRHQENLFLQLKYIN